MANSFTDLAQWSTKFVEVQSSLIPLEWALSPFFKIPIQDTQSPQSTVTEDWPHPRTNFRLTNFRPQTRLWWTLNLSQKWRQSSNPNLLIPIQYRGVSDFIRPPPWPCAGHPFEQIIWYLPISFALCVLPRYTRDSRPRSQSTIPAHQAPPCSFHQFWFNLSCIWHKFHVSGDSQIYQPTL